MIITHKELQAVLSFVSPEYPLTDYVYVDPGEAMYATDGNTAVMLTKRDTKGPPREWGDKPPGVWRGEDLRKALAYVSTEAEVGAEALTYPSTLSVPGGDAMRWGNSLPEDRGEPLVPLHEIWANAAQQTSWRISEPQLDPEHYGVQTKYLERLVAIGKACEPSAAFVRMHPSPSPADPHLYECVSGDRRWSVVIMPRLLPLQERP